jgi:hypothetical protein
MSVDPMKWSTREPGTPRRRAQNILLWIAEIAASTHKLTEFLLRRWRQRFNNGSEGRLDSVVGEAGARTKTVSFPEESIATKTHPRQPTAEIKITSTIQTDRTALVPDQNEIKRRRDLIRTLFNDFWRGSYDKPAAFVDRLDQAEAYLNERLAASGEVWRLDAKTRVVLGLPPRLKSSNQPKNDLSPQGVTERQRSQPI